MNRLPRGSVLRCALGGWIERRGCLFGPLVRGSTERRIENWGLNGGSHGKEISRWSKEFGCLSEQGPSLYTPHTGVERWLVTYDVMFLVVEEADL